MPATAGKIREVTQQLGGVRGFLPFSPGSFGHFSRDELSIYLSIHLSISMRRNLLNTKTQWLQNAIDVCNYKMPTRAQQ
jgi:hypothetical protein